MEIRFLLKDDNNHQYYYLCVPQDQLPSWLIEGAQFIQSQINPEDLTDGGLETEYHITVNFGLLDRNSYFTIRDNIIGSKEWETATCMIGLVNSFRREDKSFDVLKISIISPRLSQIHYNAVAQLHNEDENPLYEAHLTLAYIKKGSCTDLEGVFPLTGASFSINALQWRHTSGYKLPVPIKERSLTA